METSLEDNNNWMLFKESLHDEKAEIKKKRMKSMKIGQEEWIVIARRMRIQFENKKTAIKVNK